WQIDEWAGAHPGRIIPLALVPYWSGDAAAEEVRRVAKKGCRAICFLDNPAARGFASVHDAMWEPLWKACNDERVVINCHIGTGSEPPHSSDLSPMNAWITSMPISVANAAADWLHLAALHRYPDLKIALSEGGIGWIPYFLERSEFTFDHHIWTNVDMGGKRPADVFREHFITCFISDKFGLKNYEEIGEDIIAYECDYPHSDCTWPYAPEQIWSEIKDLPVPVINKITHENVMRDYSYNPFSILDREDCTVGSLRAKATHVNTEPKSQPGFNPDKGRGVVTSGDVAAAFGR
ncbi:MAG: amidohydrolase, partial [Gammaproteobacteria bacterium]|nr:amidohydrolase [Gammaproteobacteria bacterium]